MRVEDKVGVLFVSVVLLIVTFAWSLGVWANPIKIAVIDTGFDMKYKKQLNLCEEGHKDFTGTGLHDNHGHGTHVAGLVAKNTTIDYCLIILKFWDKASKTDTTLNTAWAIKWAVDNKVDMINYSGGGISFSEYEKKAVLTALDAGIVMVAAAGNEYTNLNKGNYYPAMYDSRMVVVANLLPTGERAPSSNYGGPTDLAVVGTKVESLNGKMSGTSQSTAIVTGRLANQVYIRKLLGHYDTDKYSFSLDRYMAR